MSPLPHAFHPLLQGWERCNTAAHPYPPGGPGRVYYITLPAYRLRIIMTAPTSFLYCILRCPYSWRGIHISPLMNY